MERLGPYRLVRLLARGGMGEVFLATLSREGGFEKRVALKRMLPELGRQPAFVEMFEREARLAAALNHRHIVQIFDFGQEQDGSLWLAMEHVHGVDLQSVLELCRQQGELLPCGLTVEIGLACCQALEYAHRATDAAGLPLGLVHRDVSPQNILLSYEGDVKLVDFGLAHRPGEDDGVEPGLLMGKLAYMSPEQADALPLDARSDLFSLGVVLYEASSGRRAFFGSDGSEAILRRVRAAEPLAPPDEVLAGLPGAPLAQVLRQALALHRRERFGDAQAFHDALLQAAQASGVRVGEPRLGGWLAERFPERMSLTAAWHRRVAPAEATAAAGAPIAVPAPGALRPGTARPEGAAPAVTGPLPALPADAARHGAGEVGTAAARRRYALGLAGLAAAGLAAALAYWPATPPSGEGSAPLTARAPAAIVAAMGVEPAGREGTSLRRTPAPEQVPAGATLPGQEGEAEGQLLRAEQELPRAAPSAARLDGAAALRWPPPGGGLPSGQPGDPPGEPGHALRPPPSSPVPTSLTPAARGQVLAVASFPGPGPGPGTAAGAGAGHGHVPGPDAASGPGHGPAPGADAAPGPDTAAPSGAVAALVLPTGAGTPAPDGSVPAAGAAGTPLGSGGETGTGAAAAPARRPDGEGEATRVRVAAAGAEVRLGGRPVAGWQRLEPSGLLFRVEGGSGPLVRMRLQQRGLLVRANLDSEPWAHVQLDGRSLGDTPLAEIPLRRGVRRLEVADPRGGATKLTVEVEPGW